MSSVQLFYPPTTSERYDGAVEAAAARFVELLFDHEKLGEVTGLDFREYLPGRGRTLSSLEELKDYRRNFGGPSLDSARVLVVPPSEAPQRLDGPGPYTFSGMLELNMTLSGEAIHPDWKVSGYFPEVAVPVQLRMFESLVVRPASSGDRLQEGVPLGRHMVFGRTYQPVLVAGLGEPYAQFAHVGDQVKYFLREAQPMFTSPDWVPTWKIYNRIFAGEFDGDPISHM